MFCSLCGDSLQSHEALICRHCGLLCCHFCAKQEADLTVEPLSKDIHRDFRTDNYKCTCNNGDIQVLADVRGYLIQDFLNYKHQIQLIANTPVQIFQKILEIREKLISLGSTFILMPDDFMFQRDVLSAFSNAEQFALEYLQDLRINIRNLYDQLLIHKEQLIESEELKQVNLRLSMLGGKIEKFQMGFNTYFGPLEEDIETFNQQLVDYYSSYKIFTKYSNIREVLDPNERIYFISDPLSSNLGGMINRNVQVLITDQRIIFFQQPMIKLKKKVKILKILTLYEVTGFETKGRKFRSSLLLIRKYKETIEISGNSYQSGKLNKFLKLVIEAVHVPIPKLWKHWMIGKIWSSDSYYNNIDKLLRWELRPGFTKTSNFNPSSFDFNKAETDLEYQTELIEYLGKQMEKITQRIRVCEYMINDLKSRKNTMSINEFYSLYETFSMKLKDLETERNSLLGHYSKGYPTLTH